MKRELFIPILLILGTGFSSAQKLKPVSPGEGTLEEAILAAEPDDILQLSAGGEYTLSSSSTSFGKIEFPLVIEVEPGATEKAILKLGPDAPRGKKYYYFTVNHGADLTLRGLDIHGLLNDTAIAASMIVFDARPDPGVARIGNFRFEHCLFHDFTDYIIHGMKDSYARGIIQDSVFIDDVVVYNAKHFLQYKHVSLRHLEMTRSTVFNLNGMALKIGKIGYRTVPGVTDPTITPTGFIDHCTLDSMGDIHGHIQVDDPYHILGISNCIVSNQHQYDQPPVFFQYPHADKVVIIENTCFWKVGPPNPAVGGTNWIGYLFMDTITRDPEYLYAYRSDFTLPWGSPLLTFGTDGKAIGDPRWAMDAVGLRKITMGKTRGSVLLKNYPNPFFDHTRIMYRIERAGLVTLEMVDPGGRTVSRLVREYQAAGDYTVEWDAGGMEDGIYFCKLLAGSEMSIIKVIRVR